jgi:hypothetical protein
MAGADFSIPDVTGEPPDLSGRICTAFICEQFWHDGVQISAANVIYIRADETWHRLALDAGIIQWREQTDTPQPWEVAEEGWSYPHHDLAQKESLHGVRFISYSMHASEVGCSVEFSFANGRRLVFEEVQDEVRYAAI